jgi:hypothetical protein
MVDASLELDGLDEFTDELNDFADDIDDADGYRVVNPTDYAYIIEFGRGPVTPESADALRFEVDGEVVYAMRSGPVPPQPMIRPAVDEAKRQVGAIARSADSLDEVLYRTALAVEARAKRRSPVETGTLRAAWRTQSL